MQSVTSNAVFKACSPNYANAELLYKGTSAYTAAYSVTKNGFLMGSGYGTGEANNYLYFTIGSVTMNQQGYRDEFIANMIPVRKGDSVGIRSQFATRSDGIYFVPCE